MGIMVCSLLLVMQDLYPQPYENLLGLLMINYDFLMVSTKRQKRKRPESCRRHARDLAKEQMKAVRLGSGHKASELLGFWVWGLEVYKGLGFRV